MNRPDLPASTGTSHARDRCCRLHSAKALAWILLLLPFCSLALGVEPESVRLEPKVTFVVADSVYLDMGSDHGLRVGDRVLFRVKSTILEGEIEATSSRSARVVLLQPPTAQELSAGTRAEITLPATRVPNSSGSAPSLQLPWKRNLEKESGSRPLLAEPTGVSPPKNRRSVYSGRSWFRSSTLHSLGSQSDRGAVRGAVGGNLRATNPLGYDGKIHVDGELVSRDVFQQHRSDREHRRVRIDRFFWEKKGIGGKQTQLRVGRFVSPITPELGLVDGVELQQRTQAGRIGLHLGASPTRDDDRRHAGHFGLTASYGIESDGENAVSFLAAMHQSWHRGRWDRSLLLLRAAGWRGQKPLGLIGGAHRLLCECRQEKD